MRLASRRPRNQPDDRPQGKNLPCWVRFLVRFAQARRR